MTIFNFDFHNGSENQLLTKTAFDPLHFTWGPFYKPFMRPTIEILWHLLLFQFWFWWSNQVTNLHMSQQLSCCDMCRIVICTFYHISCKRIPLQKDLEYELINCLLNVIQFCPWLILLPVGWISLIECGRTVQFLIGEVVIRELWKLFEDCWQGFLVLT